MSKNTDKIVNEIISEWPGCLLFAMLFMIVVAMIAIPVIAALAGSC